MGKLNYIQFCNLHLSFKLTSLLGVRLKLYHHSVSRHLTLGVNSQRYKQLKGRLMVRPTWSSLKIPPLIKTRSWNSFVDSRMLGEREDADEWKWKRDAYRVKQKSKCEELGSSIYTSLYLWIASRQCSDQPSICLTALCSDNEPPVSFISSSPI